MCRNIKTLFNFEPPATDEEVRAASLQFVRKLSGFTAPSKANEAAFNRAIDEMPTSRGADRRLETQRAEEPRRRSAKAKAGGRTFGRGFDLRSSIGQSISISPDSLRSLPAPAAAIASAGSACGRRAIA